MKIQTLKKNVEGIPNICLSCLLQQLLVFKGTFSMKRKQKLKRSFNTLCNKAIFHMSRLLSLSRGLFVCLVKMSGPTHAWSLQPNQCSWTYIYIYKYIHIVNELPREWKSLEKLHNCGNLWQTDIIQHFKRLRLMVDLLFCHMYAVIMVDAL